MSEQTTATTATAETEIETLPDAPELEEIPKVRDFEVWVRIKKTSKYYHQGLNVAHDPKSGVRFFKLSYFTPLPRLGLKLSRDAYLLHFNGNAYRIEDVEIFLRDAATPKNFVRLV